MSLKILLTGHKGLMGQAVTQSAPNCSAEITQTFSRGEDLSAAMQSVDVVVDFSSPSLTPSLVSTAAALGKPVIIGTTGHTQEERENATSFQNSIPIVWSSNFSIGINLLFYLTKKTAQLLGPDYHAEIIETHHKAKKDAPGGTGRRLLDIITEERAINQNQVSYGRHGIYPEGRPTDEVGIHSLRGGDTVGEHSVFFAGAGERVELVHKATDRTIYARGALAAAHWVMDQSPGLYSMENILGIVDEKVLA